METRGPFARVCVEDTGFLGVCPKAAERAGPRGHGESASGDSELWVPDPAGAQGNEGLGRGEHPRPCRGGRAAGSSTTGPECGQPETLVPLQEMRVLHRTQAGAGGCGVLTVLPTHTQAFDALPASCPAEGLDPQEAWDLSSRGAGFPRYRNQQGPLRRP